MLINAVSIWGKPDHQLSTRLEKTVSTIKESDTEEANGSCMSLSNTDPRRTVAGQVQPNERPNFDCRKTGWANCEVTRSTEPIVSTINGAHTEPIQFPIWNAQ